jgi:hypothetical protein
MRFVPKSEDELNPLLPAGDYDAEVTKAEAAVSQKKNDMIKLTLRIFDHNGGTIIINDYLLEAMLKKLKHFCDSAGLTDIYERGELTPECCHGASVIVKLKIKHDETGVYPPKNAVDDYVTRKSLPKNPQPRGTGLSGRQLADANAELAADECPF